MSATAIRLLALLLCSAFYVNATQDESNDETEPFVSVNQIEQALALTDITSNIDGVRVSIDLNIEFTFSSDQLKKGGEQQIAALADALKSDELVNCHIQLIGHTDATGSQHNNQRLSELRAERVKQVLVQQHQLSAQRLIVEGKGETQLLVGLADNDSRHRRVEVALLDPAECRASTDGIQW